MARPQSWLIPCSCVPCENAAAYHGFAANVAAAEAAASAAARGLAGSPKTTSSIVVHARQECASASHVAEPSAHQRQGCVDKEPGVRFSLSHVAWSRDRPRPAAEVSDFAGHSHDMSAAALHPLKQVHNALAPHHTVYMNWNWKWCDVRLNTKSTKEQLQLKLFACNFCWKVQFLYVFRMWGAMRGFRLECEFYLLSVTICFPHYHE